MNAIPNRLINNESLDFERKRLEAEQEILANIEEFASLFEKIRQSKDINEFQKIVNENSEAANDSSYKTENNPVEEKSEEINSENIDDSTQNQAEDISESEKSEEKEEETSNSPKISLWINNKINNLKIIKEDEEDDFEKDLNWYLWKDEDEKSDDDEPRTPKIKLNL